MYHACIAFYRFQTVYYSSLVKPAFSKAAGRGERRGDGVGVSRGAVHDAVIRGTVLKI